MGLLLLLWLLLLLLPLLLLLLLFLAAALRRDVCLGDFLKSFAAMAVVLVDIESVFDLFFDLSICRTKARRAADFPLEGRGVDGGMMA